MHTISGGIRKKIALLPIASNLAHRKFINLPKYVASSSHRSVIIIILSCFKQFLACNHVTRRPCWLCVGGEYNKIISEIFT